MGKAQVAKTGAKVLLNKTDLAAVERIIRRDPTILNVTDAVRVAIHEKDRRATAVAA